MTEHLIDSSLLAWCSEERALAPHGGGRVALHFARGDARDATEPRSTGWKWKARAALKSDDLAEARCIRCGSPVRVRTFTGGAADPERRRFKARALVIEAGTTAQIVRPHYRSSGQACPGYRVAHFEPAGEGRMVAIPFGFKEGDSTL